MTINEQIIAENQKIQNIFAQIKSEWMKSCDFEDSVKNKILRTIWINHNNCVGNIAAKIASNL